MPPQQSMSAPHASPVCTQKDGAVSQRPSLQKCEQQSPLSSHALPEVAQPALSGAHVPSLHTLLQHSPSLSQASPSEVHWSPLQWKSTHENEQQSRPAPHDSPSARHSPATR